MYQLFVCTYGLYLYVVCINIVCKAISVYLWCVRAYGVNLYGVLVLVCVCVDLCVVVGDVSSLKGTYHTTRCECD